MLSSITLLCKVIDNKVNDSPGKYSYDKPNHCVQNGVLGAGNGAAIALRYYIAKAADNNHNYRYGTNKEQEDAYNGLDNLFWIGRIT